MLKMPRSTTCAASDFVARSSLCGLSAALLRSPPIRTTGRLSRPGGPQSPGSTKRHGCATRSTRSFWPGSKNRGLPHAPEADRATLLRRLSFDLTGLPPTPDEVDAFLADRSPAGLRARWSIVCLASPHYGERWGQHWLDLARFAETDGFEFDQARPDAWRYRDWVVRRSTATCLMTPSSACSLPATRSSPAIRRPSSPPASIAVIPTWST